MWCYVTLFSDKTWENMCCGILLKTECIRAKNTSKQTTHMNNKEHANQNNNIQARNTNETNKLLRIPGANMHVLVLSLNLCTCLSIGLQGPMAIIWSGSPTCSRTLQYLRNRLYIVPKMTKQCNNINAEYHNLVRSLADRHRGRVSPSPAHTKN